MYKSMILEMYGIVQSHTQNISWSPKSSVFINFTFLDILYEWNYIVYKVLCLAFLE